MHGARLGSIRGIVVVIRVLELRRLGCWDRFDGGDGCRGRPDRRVCICHNIFLVDFYSHSTANVQTKISLILILTFQGTLLIPPPFSGCSPVYPDFVGFLLVS